MTFEQGICIVNVIIFAWLWYLMLWQRTHQKALELLADEIRKLKGTDDDK
jgi:hypothetical protein